jgi:single-strand DNA-binding protein
MPSMNSVTMMGHLTRAPEMKYLPSGTPVCEFGLAMNRVWKDKGSGEKKEEVCFVDCKAWGRQGEIVSQYVPKGGLILLQGRLAFRTWEAQDGSRRSKHEVVVEHVTLMPQRDGAGGAPGGGGHGDAYQPKGQTQAPPQAAPGHHGGPGAYGGPSAHGGGNQGGFGGPPQEDSPF